LHAEISNEDETPVEKGKRIVKAAYDDGVTLRLIGGLAVRFHCHGPHSSHLRAYNDIDLFGLNKELGRIYSVFQKLGYSPNDKYNVLYGATRLQFIDQKSAGHVDIFLDKFIMDHTLDFRRRLQLDKLTIPITDLLLTKLQIVRLAAKDATDIIAILEDHEIGLVNGQETLNVEYIAELCSSNWGLHKTVTDNLLKMTEIIEKRSLEAAERKDLVRKLEAIQNIVKIMKKTLRWRLRSVIGERVRWYQDIESGEGEI